MTRISTFLATALTLACARPAAAQPGCRIPAGQFLQIGTGLLEVVPGQVRVLAVGPSIGPDTPPTPLPRACRVRWFVSAGAPARIDAAGRLAVSPRAAPGAKFVVSAAVGRSTAAQAVQVVDPRIGPLAGRWEQAQPATCSPAGQGAMEPVRDLVFQRNGEFSVTFVPFESYRDYWGRYTYDAATGALALRVEHANQPPADADLAGTARVSGGTVTMRGFWLGDPRQPRAGRTCTYVFTRQR